ncbi:MAG: hypothetical protein C9356_09325 [Oleiphilus sp.]|nr:MAG: hypothetical protein C9356_09325 [Oleiphilus sp.]
MKKLILSSLVLLTACGGGGGGSGSSESSVKSDTNEKPVAVAGSSQSVDELTAVHLDGSSSSDSDGTIVSYEWEQISNGAPSVGLFNRDRDKCSFTAPEVTVDTSFQFKLTVTDDRGASDSSVVEVNVNNIPAVADSLAGRSWGEEISLESGPGNVSDPVVKVSSTGVAFVSWVQFDGSYYDLRISKVDLVDEVQTEYGVVSDGDDSVQDSAWNYKYASYPQHDLALLDNGNVVIAFIDNLDTHVNVVVYDALLNSWGSPEVISGEISEARHPVIVSNGTEVSVAWFQEDSVAGTNLWVSAFDRVGGTWNAAELLGNATGVDEGIGVTEGHLCGVMSRDDDITLLWSGDPGVGEENILVNRYKHGSGWSAVQSIDNLAGEAGAPAIAIDAGDNVHAVWVQDDGVDYSIFYSEFENNASLWRAPVAIEAVAGISYSPDITVSGDKVLVTWVRANSLSSYLVDIYANDLDSGVWQGEERVTDLARALPLISSDNDGNAMILYHSTHTQHAKKIGAADWGSSNHVTPYNAGKQHYFDINDDGLGAAVWVARNNGVDDLILSIYK